MANKSSSVRKIGDVVEIRVFSDNVIVWKATAPVGDKKKLKSMIATLNSKWLELDLSGDSWWDF